MNLLTAFQQFCSRIDFARTIWIAYSGGLDSHVLLFLCHQLNTQKSFKFRVIHVNHNISPHAASWAKHCREMCEQYAMDYIERDVHLNYQQGESPEEAARDARYSIFAEYLDQDDLLLTAHHQDDQAETVLLQLMRGAGPKGLSAMPVIKPFAKGFHVRPLLDFPRTELLQYAQENHLQWIEDESNQDTALSRNFIRHEVLPLLQSRWPKVSASLSRSALHCAENQSLLEDYLQDDYQQVIGSRTNTLSVSKLLSFDVAKQRLLLRAWIYQMNCPLPDTKKMQSIQQNVLSAAWDKLPLVQWGDVRLRRHRDDLYLLSAIREPDVNQTFEWNMDQSLVLPHGILKTSLVQGRGLRLDKNLVSVRFRQGGEVVDLPARGRHTLKNLFQEWNILPWERDHLPLIFMEEKLIAIAGWYVHEDFIATENEMGREIIFERE